MEAEEIRMNRNKIGLFCLLFSLILLGETPPKKLLPGEILQRLFDRAEPGSTLSLPPGHYRAVGLKIRKPLTILGHHKVILDAQGKGEILTVEARGVTLRGLIFQNVGVSFIEDWAAVRLKNTSHCTVENCEIRNSFFGIYIENSQKCTIRNNKILGKSVREVVSGNGIHGWHCRKLTIENNIIQSHRDGIYFEFVEDSKIVHNLSEKNIRYGLHFMFSHRNQYRYNLFRRNGAGVAVMYTRGVVMEHNIFAWNWGGSSFGLLLKEIDDSVVRSNLFFYNTVGLYAEGSNRILVEKNIFQNNGYAFRLLGNSTSFQVQYNNFFGNSFDVTTNSTYNANNVFQKNYWDHYSGYDLTKDGIGDIPYYPVSLFAYIVEQEPPAIILFRSFFVDLLNVAEQIAPVLIPVELKDEKPKIEPHPWKPPQISFQKFE